MGSSRKSRNRNDAPGAGDAAGVLRLAFERALGDILARVCISAPAQKAALAVAFSGGLDSSVLLRLAGEYAAAHGLSLFAFHVHHGLSPNAERWLEHSRAEAGRCGAAFDAARISIAPQDKRGIEEAARAARYAALGELCRRHGAAVLLTGHHEDDQAETVFLQLLRGAGLAGLSGMGELQKGHELLGPDVAIARPLLHIARAQIEAAARSLGIVHVEDESNAQARFRRNALRGEIFPLLQAHFPGFAKCVARSARHAQAAQDLLRDLALLDLAACRAGADGRALDLDGLGALPVARADNLLRLWLQQQGVRAPSAARLAELRMQALSAAPDNHPFSDFGALRLQRVGRRLELHPLPGDPPREPIALRWRDEDAIAVPQWRGRLVFERIGGPGLDPARLREGGLCLRPRAGSERLRIAANRPSRSLKLLYQEALIPPWRRAWLPLLYLDEELVFGAGLGMDARRLQDGGVTLRWESDWSAPEGRAPA